MVGGWISEREMAEVVRSFAEVEAAVAPIYDVRDVMADPQFAALGTIATVADEELGPLKMQNVMFRLSETPGRIRWAGRRVGQDNAEVLGELGISAERQRELREKGVV
jgi:crotonobetainyl-CoA:carnitine CoA-transferase CaiB-like acyl-CoA transferase